MPSIDSVKFDTTGWTLEQITFEVMRWTNHKQQILSLHFFDLPPDIPCPLTDLAELRAAYRIGLAQSGAALISADVFPVAGLDCVRLIFKSPRQPSGMVYVGSLTFPFENFSYVVKIQCAEIGTTGVRDAMVLDMLMQEGVVAFDPETATIAGWAADPYDPTFSAPLLSNRSDDETFDQMFPEHPLTDVRTSIYRILQTLRADDAVMVSPRFVGPHPDAPKRPDPREATKPWWKLW